MFLLVAKKVWIGRELEFYDKHSLSWNTVVNLKTALSWKTALNWKTAFNWKNWN